MNIKEILEMPAREAADMLMAMGQVLGQANLHKAIKAIHKECRNEKK